jgi:hypothetical protein
MWLKVVAKGKCCIDHGDKMLLLQVLQHMNVAQKQ